jgi:hypothetical protein
MHQTQKNFKNQKNHPNQKKFKIQKKFKNKMIINYNSERIFLNLKLILIKVFFPFCVLTILTIF